MLHGVFLLIADDYRQKIFVRLREENDANGLMRNILSNFLACS